MVSYNREKIIALYAQMIRFLPSGTPYGDYYVCIYFNRVALKKLGPYQYKDYEGHEYLIHSLAVEPTSGLIASLDADQLVNIWSPSMDLTYALPMQGGLKPALAFHPRGYFWPMDKAGKFVPSARYDRPSCLALGFDGGVQFIEFEAKHGMFSKAKWKLGRRFTTGDMATFVWFNATGSRLYIGHYGRLEIWDVEREVRLASIPVNGYVRSIANLKDGAVAVVTNAPTDNLYMVEPVAFGVQMFQAHSDGINDVYCAPGSDIFFTAANRSMKAWVGREAHHLHSWEFEENILSVTANDAMTMLLARHDEFDVHPFEITFLEDLAAKYR